MKTEAELNELVGRIKSAWMGGRKVTFRALQAKLTRELAKFDKTDPVAIYF